MLGGDLFHTRCCAHILNLIIKDGLDVINVIREMAKRMVENFDKYWSMVHGVVGVSIVLDPRTIDIAKLELDHYLSEAALPKSMGFDELNWWKSHQPKYPILQAMARDLLAIPVSTVASESAFSMSGRLVSPHRSRLHPETMEALMCAQSWLWAAEMKGNQLGILYFSTFSKIKLVLMNLLGESTLGYATIYDDAESGDSCVTREVIGICLTLLVVLNCILLILIEFFCPFKQM
ncbi:hypothetical protein RHGRI_023915 [Rhododendron griersonianum]|uniref:Transposase n=1 Tax=Rhododendron griersonianum TaxID=479676 RepID=A0AAV6J5L7_9ERIC|nr:hypothetical protein RHGRI_023915 [Rhododendron griersonianum]